MNLALPTTCKDSVGFVVPIPTEPWLIIKLTDGVIVMFPEVLLIEDVVPATLSGAVGAVVPIPSLEFVSSQNTFEKAVHTPALLYIICPSVPIGITTMLPDV